LIYITRGRAPSLACEYALEVSHTHADALGAQQSQVFKLILGHGLKIITLGLVLGLAGAFALSRLIRGLLFNVTPSDPLTFVLFSGTLFFIAMLAAALPARRATRVDPQIALRNE
jgi:ABC-type lipoprotein release transport system permease subunit